MSTDDRGNDPLRRAAAKSSGAKRPYAKPRLQEYGSIAKLTQSGGSTKPETPSMHNCL